MLCRWVPVLAADQRRVECVALTMLMNLIDLLFSSPAPGVDVRAFQGLWRDPEGEKAKYSGIPGVSVRV